MTTILVVDDEYLIADILSFALEDEGFMVVTASNGQKGLEVLDRERPALIITDFMMPVMDGLEFATAVRALPCALGRRPALVRQQVAVQAAAPERASRRAGAEFLRASAARAAAAIRPHSA